MRIRSQAWVDYLRGHTKASQLIEAYKKVLPKNDETEVFLKQLKDIIEKPYDLQKLIKTVAIIDALDIEKFSIDVKLQEFPQVNQKTGIIQVEYKPFLWVILLQSVLNEKDFTSEMSKLDCLEHCCKEILPKIKSSNSFISNYKNFLDKSLKEAYTNGLQILADYYWDTNPIKSCALFLKISEENLCDKDAQSRADYKIAYLSYYFYITTQDKSYLKDLEKICLKLKYSGSNYSIAGAFLEYKVIVYKRFAEGVIDTEEDTVLTNLLLTVTEWTSSDENRSLELETAEILFLLNKFQIHFGKHPIVIKKDFCVRACQVLQKELMKRNPPLLSQNKTAISDLNEDVFFEKDIHVDMTSRYWYEGLCLDKERLNTPLFLFSTRPEFTSISLLLNKIINFIESRQVYNQEFLNHCLESIKTMSNVLLGEKLHFLKPLFEQSLLFALVKSFIVQIHPHCQDKITLFKKAIQLLEPYLTTPHQKTKAKIKELLNEIHDSCLKIGTVEALELAKEVKEKLADGYTPNTTLTIINEENQAKNDFKKGLGLFDDLTAKRKTGNTHSLETVMIFDQAYQAFQNAREHVIEAYYYQAKLIYDKNNLDKNDIDLKNIDHKQFVICLLKLVQFITNEGKLDLDYGKKAILASMLSDLYRAHSQGKLSDLPAVLVNDSDTFTPTTLKSTASQLYQTVLLDTYSVWIANKLIVLEELNTEKNKTIKAATHKLADWYWKCLFLGKFDEKIFDNLIGLYRNYEHSDSICEKLSELKKEATPNKKVNPALIVDYMLLIHTCDTENQTELPVLLVNYFVNLPEKAVDLDCLILLENCLPQLKGKIENKKIEELKSKINKIKNADWFGKAICDILIHTLTSNDTMQLTKLIGYLDKNKHAKLGDAFLTALKDIHSEMLSEDKDVEKLSNLFISVITILNRTYKSAVFERTNELREKLIEHLFESAKQHFNLQHLILAKNILQGIRDKVIYRKLQEYFEMLEKLILSTQQTNPAPTEPPSPKATKDLPQPSSTPKTENPFITNTPSNTETQEQSSQGKKSKRKRKHKTTKTDNNQTQTQTNTQALNNKKQNPNSNKSKRAANKASNTEEDKDQDKKKTPRDKVVAKQLARRQEAEAKLEAERKHRELLANKARREQEERDLEEKIKQEALAKELAEKVKEEQRALAEKMKEELIAKELAERERKAEEARVAAEKAKEEEKARELAEREQKAEEARVAAEKAKEEEKASELAEKIKTEQMALAEKAKLIVQAEQLLEKREPREDRVNLAPDQDVCQESLPAEVYTFEPLEIYDQIDIGRHQMFRILFPLLQSLYQHFSRKNVVIMVYGGVLRDERLGIRFNDIDIMIAEEAPLTPIYEINEPGFAPIQLSRNPYGPQFANHFVANFGSIKLDFNFSKKLAKQIVNLGLDEALRRRAAKCDATINSLFGVIRFPYIDFYDPTGKALSHIDNKILSFVSVIDALKFLRVMVERKYKYEVAALYQPNFIFNVSFDILTCQRMVAASLNDEKKLDRGHLYAHLWKAFNRRSAVPSFLILVRYCMFHIYFKGIEPSTHNWIIHRLHEIDSRNSKPSRPGLFNIFIIARIYSDFFRLVDTEYFKNNIMTYVEKYMEEFKFSEEIKKEIRQECMEEIVNCLNTDKIHEFQNLSPYPEVFEKNNHNGGTIFVTCFDYFYNLHGLNPLSSAPPQAKRPPTSRPPGLFREFQSYPSPNLTVSQGPNQQELTSTQVPLQAINMHNASSNISGYGQTMQLWGNPRRNNSRSRTEPNPQKLKNKNKLG